MLGEKFVKFVPGSVLVLINFESKLLAEHKSVSETTIDWGKTTQHHGQESVECCDLSTRLEESRHDLLYVLFEGLDEIKGESI